MAGALSRTVAPVGSMIKKGMTAVQRAVGQTPPTAQDVRKFLDAQGIPMRHTEQLIQWGIMPHTKLSADSLGLNTQGNQDHWHARLRKWIPDDNQRQAFIKPFVDKHIGIWLPWV